MPTRQRSVAAFLICLLGAALLAVGTPPLYWPTPNPAFFEGADWEEITQPTASGKPESALFGCVRNGGSRFHEGLDLKPIGRDRNHEATDAIYAVMPGRVAYINKIAGNSSYGRYIVLEHPEAEVPVYTLYAHLASIEKGLHVGALIEGGQRIGTMGRSAGGYSIPRQRAHLHFEIGLRKSSDFDQYYKAAGFSGKNHHGDYSGLNLIGADPVHFWDAVRTQKFKNFREYFHGLPTAFTLRIGTASVPEFINRYPSLLTKPIPVNGVSGWDIEYTWYGLPKKWTPLGPEAFPYGAKEGDLALLSFDPEAFKGQCRDTLSFKSSDPQGTVKPGKNLKSDLKMLFGF
ncbi:M23 family metallopeptidase [Cerasicoccus maritimus]|uniref:M23 family metallopeptidase n=1 Tax=Cerasicoccus maritimus TaxID=490089 RepID=UPI00285256F3|nr:M23 family metallopeptidase [Cerasicoccus maritimus]